MQPWRGAEQSLEAEALRVGGRLRRAGASLNPEIQSPRRIHAERHTCVFQTWKSWRTCWAGGGAGTPGERSGEAIGPAGGVGVEGRALKRAGLGQGCVSQAWLHGCRCRTQIPGSLWRGSDPPS